MEKYVKIGVVAIVIFAVAVVGGIVCAGSPEDVNPDQAEELNLNEDSGEKQSGLPTCFDKDFMSI